MPCFAQDTSETDLSSVEEWQQWREVYRDELIGEHGWLKLVGLYWLKTGSNSIGSHESNNHFFPDSAPLFVGNIKLKDDSIEFSTENPNVRVNGKKVSVSQLSVKDKTEVSFGTYSFYIIKRENKFAVRLRDKNSPFYKNFKGERFYPFNSKYIVEATLVPHKTDRKLKVATVYGTLSNDKSAGFVEFELNGKRHRLEAVDYGKEYPLFVMFRDKTSGDTTYGAGRFIDVDWPNEEGATTIDFNRAYSPACAHTAYATCPLPPKHNFIDTRLEVGELYKVH